MMCLVNYELLYIYAPSNIYRASMELCARINRVSINKDTSYICLLRIYGLIWSVYMWEDGNGNKQNITYCRCMWKGYSRGLWGRFSWRHQKRISTESDLSSASRQENGRWGLVEILLGRGQCKQRCMCMKSQSSSGDSQNHMYEFSFLD